MTEQPARRRAGGDVGDLHRTDFYAWALAQADLLRAGRFADLDLGNLVDAVEGLALTERNAALSNARVVVEHLLKLEHSPAAGPRNKWRATVREHRSRLDLDLTDALREELAADLARVYRRARADAEGSMRDFGEAAAAARLPAACPYAMQQIVGDWWPPDPPEALPPPGKVSARRRSR